MIRVSGWFEGDLGWQSHHCTVGEARILEYRRDFRGVAIDPKCPRTLGVFRRKLRSRKAAVFLR